MWSQLVLLLHHWLVWSLPISIDILFLNTWIYRSLALIGSAFSPQSGKKKWKCISISNWNKVWVLPLWERFSVASIQGPSCPLYIIINPPGGWRPMRAPRRWGRRSCGVSGPGRGSPPCPGDILAMGAGVGVVTSPCQPPHCSWCWCH